MYHLPWLCTYVCLMCHYVTFVISHSMSMYNLISLLRDSDAVLVGAVGCL